ncbi:acyl-[acyl-carrier-protein] thioesterase [Neolewinella aurantiaca]|uniref:acyl-[acyl-carrier-protein] thioesterase n=1 Tax=Neolewinella aurantiaca TaxID=2602767 RepID=UPI0016505635|nr:acyl-ACP thioesterase domain-containing protein [Neolewinella aurantiaca]
MNNPLTQSPLHDTIIFQVPAFAVGPHGYLSLPHLIRILQEAAMQNSVRLKISSPEMIEAYGCSWVVRRQRVEISRWPVLGEEIVVTTAPSGFARKLQTFRDFHLVDETGQTIITAATQWLMMDISSRRLKTIPPAVTALEADLAPATAHLKRPDNKIPAPAQSHLSTKSRVTFSQLDFNDHLTNPVFPELMLEPLGHDFLRQHLPSSADIMFHKEARYGDTLEAVAGFSDGPLRYDHALLRDGETLATMHTSWKKPA